MFTFCLIQYHLPHSTSTHRKEKNVGLPLVNVISLNTAMDPLHHVKKTFLFRMAIRVERISGSVSVGSVSAAQHNARIHLVKVFIII